MPIDTDRRGSAEPASMESSSGAVAAGGCEGGTVILVPSQNMCIGRSPGKRSDTRTMAAASDGDSRDIVHGKYSCMAV